MLFLRGAIYAWKGNHGRPLRAPANRSAVVKQDTIRRYIGAVRVRAAYLEGGHMHWRRLVILSLLLAVVATTGCSFRRAATPPVDRPRPICRSRRCRSWRDPRCCCRNASKARGPGPRASPFRAIDRVSPRRSHQFSQPYARSCRREFAFPGLPSHCRGPCVGILLRLPVARPIPSQGGEGEIGRPHRAPRASDDHTALILSSSRNGGPAGSRCDGLGQER